MTEADHKPAILDHPRQRVILGRVLLVAGLAGWCATVGFLVATQKGNALVGLLALLSWMVFFVGKTLLKTREPRR